MATGITALEVWDMLGSAHEATSPTQWVYLAISAVWFNVILKWTTWGGIFDLFWGLRYLPNSPIGSSKQKNLPGALGSHWEDHFYEWHRVTFQPWQTWANKDLQTWNGNVLCKTLDALSRFLMALLHLIATNPVCRFTGYPGRTRDNSDPPILAWMWADVRIWFLIRRPGTHVLVNSHSAPDHSDFTAYPIRVYCRIQINSSVTRHSQFTLTPAIIFPRF